MTQFEQVFWQFIVAALLIFITISIQTVFNIAILYWVLRVFRQLEINFNLFWRISVIARVIFAFIGVHLVQISIWALGYLLLGLFPVYADALFYSLAVFSTSDTAGITLPDRWRLLGPFEGLSGIIAFGLSIGFMFTVIGRLLESRMQRRR